MAQSVVQFPCPVRRILLVWRDGKWEIQRETRVESMTLTKSSELPVAKKVSGFWYEVVDFFGTVVYRTVMAGPIRGTVEMFGVGPPGEPVHTPAMSPRKEVGVSILIPDLPQIAEVHLYSSFWPGSDREGLGAAERIAVISVRERTGDPHGQV